MVEKKVQLRRVSGGLEEILRLGTIDVATVRDKPFAVSEEWANRLLEDGTGRFQPATAKKGVD